jgi:hypothetical protein
VGKLQTGRFERLGARTYSIKGPGALVDLDETVLGVLQLERQAGMESHLMQQWETFSTAETRAASVGSYSYIMLSNPAGSNRLLVLDGWMRNSSAMMRIMITSGAPPPFAATNLGQPIDTRMSSGKQPSGNMLVAHTNIAQFGGLIAEQADSAWNPYQVVLAPDGTIVFRSGAQNEELVLTVRWAEREAAPFEL